MRIETPVSATSRITTGYRQLIEVSIGMIPDDILDRMQLRFLTGVDPNFVGLHSYSETEPEKGARALNSTEHCAYTFNQDLPKSQQATTIVLPRPFWEADQDEGKWTMPFVVVHEIGHVLHETFDFEPDFEPVNDYAAVDEYEAFACAFAGWVWGDDIVHEIAPEAIAFFNALTG